MVKTVENHDIKDGDNLYLLTYRWTYYEGEITVKGTDEELQGVEREDTITGIKVKIQDQMGIPVNKIQLRHRQSEVTSVSKFDKKPFQQKNIYNVTAVVEYWGAWCKINKWIRR